MNWRLRLLSCGLFTLWGIVALRLVYLQGWRHEEFSRQALAQQRLVETIPARPGDILDRNGRLLATTVTVYSVFVDPSRIDDHEQIARVLGEALQLDQARLLEHLTAHRERQFVWIKRRLAEDEVDRLLELNLPRHIGGLRPEFQRRYPHRHLAAHVLGWQNIDGVGQQGVERTLQSRLAGRDGSRTLVRDARGYVLDILEEVTQPPEHGSPVRLTIDLDLQAAAERQLDDVIDRWKARSASIVVIDPQTGELLALASRPTFDPNAPAASPADSWINRAVAVACEPGSTFKPIVAAWGVQSRAIDPAERFDCGRGVYRMGTRLLHDTHPHGELDVGGILVKSSNIGMARIGERMGNDQLFAAVQAFGFGRRTGIELPAESPGIVRPLEQWDHYSTGSIPMGQELAATPLQILRAHAALANGGRLITPHLVRPEGTPSRRAASVVMTNVLDPQIADWLRTGPLVEVVTSGTARRAALEGVTVFAKTGTAQIYDARAGAYSADRYVSSCLAGAPAESPRALVLVTVCDAQSEGEPFGGLVAAPAAATVLERALQLDAPLRTAHKAARAR
jgi:cell division protein FtsI (penicillin-binding protein 3)